MEPRFEKLRQRFQQVFREESRHQVVARAPGRVVLMGDHTDYNAGWSLATNLPTEAIVVGSRRNDGMLGMYSVEYDERIQVPLASLKYLADDGWANYPKSVIWALETAGQKFGGMNILITSNVLQGGGLASSTAIEAAVALVAATLEGFTLERPALAKNLQKAENQFIGAPSSILEPLSILSCEKGNALFVDCREQTTEQIPLMLDGAVLVVLDSGVSRSLKGGEHAKRREECKEALKALKARNEAYETLRDVRVLAFERHKKFLPPILAKRAEHVIYENDRVLKMVEALRAGDLPLIGELMDRSHHSLSKLFKASTEEVDALVELAKRHEACLGARMTGGGFGGCAVALVKEEGLSSFLEQLPRAYRAKVGGKTEAWVVDIVEPASEIEDESEEIDEENEGMES